MNMKDISQIKIFIAKHGFSKEDVISLSDLNKQRTPLETGWSDFPFWRKDYRIILKKIRQIGEKYKLSFRERVRFGILLQEAPLISDSNYESMMSWGKKEQEIRRKKREESVENLEKLMKELHDAEFKKCPDCAEDVKKDARVCKHCSYRWE